MSNPTLERAMKAIDMTVDFRDGWMTPESAERTVRAVLMSVRDADGRALRKKVRETESWLTAREGFTAMIDAILAPEPTAPTDVDAS